MEILAPNFDLLSIQKCVFPLPKICLSSCQTLISYPKNIEIKIIITIYNW